jgi:hypothetical protein
METLIYPLEADDCFINPEECRTIEYFGGESKLIGRIFREKVPPKQEYALMKQQGRGFPKVIGTTSNMRTASDRLLRRERII